MARSEKTSLVEATIRTLWAQNSKVQNDAIAPLTEDELVARIAGDGSGSFTNNSLSKERNVDNEKRIKTMLPHLVGRGIMGSHTYPSDGAGVTIYWLKPVPGVGNTPASSAPLTADSPVATKVAPQSRVPNATPKRFTAFKSPLRPAGTGSATNAIDKTPVKTPRGLRSGAIHRPFKSPFKSPMPTISKNMDTLSSTPGSVDLHPELQVLLKSKKELEASIAAAEDRNRKLRLVNGYYENDEIRKVDALVVKWRSATREILAQLRDAIGPIVMSSSGSGGFGSNSGWGGFGDNQSNDDDKEGAGYALPEEPRLPSLKELCATLKFDIVALGEYDEDEDSFID